MVKYCYSETLVQFMKAWRWGSYYDITSLLTRGLDIWEGSFERVQQASRKGNGRRF